MASFAPKLKSIRKEQSPAGAEGIGWYRYVITQGDNAIVGHRQGTITGVTLAVEKILLQLNERRLGNFSRAIVDPPPYLIKTSPT